MRHILFGAIIVFCFICIFNLKAETHNNTAKKEDGITFKVLRILNDNDNAAVIISVFNTGENKITLHIPSSAKEFWSQCHIDNGASYDKKSVIGSTTLKEKYDTITLEPSQGFFMFVNLISITDIAKKILLPLHYQFVICKGKLFRVYQNHRICHYWRLVTTKSLQTLTL